MNIVKGTRVQIRVFVAQPFGSHSLAGMMLKVSARQVEFSGTVRHVRGDHPTVPTKFALWVEPDEGCVLPEGTDLKVSTCEKCGCVEVGPLSPSTIVGLDS